MQCTHIIIKQSTFQERKIKILEIVNWQFAQVWNLDFVEMDKSHITFLTIIDSDMKSIIICCIQQRIQQL